MSELVKGKYFRVNYISRAVGFNVKTHELEVKQCDFKEGLAVEMRDKDYKDKEVYYVVAFIEPHEYQKSSLDTDTVEFADMNEGGVDLKEVDFRTVDMIDETMSMEDLWEMMQEYRNCVNFAKNAVLEALGE